MKQLILLLTLLLGLNGTGMIACKKLDLSIEKFKTNISRIITARQRTGDLWRDLGINKQSKAEEQKIIKEMEGLLEKLSTGKEKKIMITITERRPRDKNDISKNWFRFGGLK